MSFEHVFKHRHFLRFCNQQPIMWVRKKQFIRWYVNLLSGLLLLKVICHFYISICGDMQLNTKRMQLSVFHGHEYGISFQLWLSFPLDIYFYVDFQMQDVNPLAGMWFFDSHGDCSLFLLYSNWTFFFWITFDFDSLSLVMGVWTYKVLF